MHYAMTSPEGNVALGIEHCVWATTNKNTNFMNPRRTWPMDELVGSYIWVTVKEQHKVSVFKIISNVDESLDTPWPEKVYGPVRVEPVTGIIPFPSGINNAMFRGYRGLSRVAKACITNKMDEAIKMFNNVKKNQVITKDWEKIFDHPIVFDGTHEEGTDLIAGKQFTQSGGTETLVFNILCCFYVWKKPANVCVLFSGSTSSNQLQWESDVRKLFGRIDESIRPSIYPNVAAFKNARKTAFKTGKPIVILATYKEYTQVTELSNSLMGYRDIQVVNAFDEAQKVFVETGKQLSIMDTPKKGDIHKMLGELVKGQLWNTVSNLYLSATPLSSVFKEENSARPFSYIWKPTISISDGGDFVAVKDMIHKYRSDNYFVQMAECQFTEDHIKDLCDIPAFNTNYNLIPISVGTKQLNPQRKLARSIKNVREQHNIFGSFYAVYNGEDGFAVLGEKDEYYFDTKGKSLKECISEFETTVPNAKHAMLFIVTDVLSACNVSYINQEGTRRCWGQFMYYNDGRADRNGLEDGIQLIRCEGYHAELPTLFSTEKMIQDTIVYAQETERVFRNKIANPQCSIADTTINTKARPFSREHHYSHKLKKDKIATSDPTEKVKSHVIELRCDDKWQMDLNKHTSRKTVDTILYDKLVDYCNPGFKDRHAVMRNQKIAGEKNSRSVALNKELGKIVTMHCPDLPSGTMRYIEGSDTYKRSDRGNDVSIYIRADWSKIYASESQYQVDRLRKCLWWVYGTSIYMRVVDIDGETGLLHDFDGSLKSFHLPQEDGGWRATKS